MITDTLNNLIDIMWTVINFCGTFCICAFVVGFAMLILLAILSLILVFFDEVGLIDWVSDRIEDVKDIWKVGRRLK